MKEDLRPYFGQLDGLRFFAIFGVLIGHWYQPSITNQFFKSLPYGAGVILFFVISGFLITKILIEFKLKNESQSAGNWTSLRSFFIRRSLRIFPIYYVLIISLFIFDFSNTRELMGWLASYSINIKMSIANSFPLNFTHFWSLAVEEQFYLFWPIIIVLVPKINLKQVIIFSIIFSLLIKYYLVLFTSCSMASSSLVFTNMHSLGLGALMAYFFVTGKIDLWFRNVRLLKNIGALSVLVYLLVYCLLIPNNYLVVLMPLKSMCHVYLFGLIVLIAIMDGFNGVAKFLLENRVVVYLGKISYGMYLFHMFIGPLYFHFINKYLQLELEGVGLFVAFFVINVIISSVSWHLIESPINGLKKHFPYHHNGKNIK